MQTHQRTWKTFQRRHLVVRFVVKVSLVAVVGLLPVGMGHIEAARASSVHVQPAGTTGHIKVARTSSVHAEQPVGRCSQNTGTNGLRLSRRDTRADHAISLHRRSRRFELHFCRTVTSTRAGHIGSTRLHQPIKTQRSANMPRPQQKHQMLKPYWLTRGNRNVFPYGQCTWWANQRYRQLHGAYVPWKMAANAWQWTARAYEFGWHVSQRPSIGAIIDLQPWVQGSYALGHVAVVERVLGDGRVLASTMNWGWRSRWEVTQWIFSPGPGVTFISS